MKRIFVYNLAALLLISALTQPAGANDPHIEMWRYGPEGSDNPAECAED